MISIFGPDKWVWTQFTYTQLIIQILGVVYCKISLKYLYFNYDLKYANTFYIVLFSIKAEEEILFRII